ncbi:PhoX family protein [Campylobacter hominis]|uniref:PhoX family protein n=1 Tax=Campylobacter hominis TaxID=76517 RepID=UPI00248D03D4|nr:alkaline phosphatase PhoX [Campylobacter hominis]
MTKTVSLVAASVCFAVAAELTDIEFNEVKIPLSDTEKRAINASDGVKISGKEYKIGYNIIMRSGDKVGDEIFGALYDINGKLITTKDGSPRISNDNDFSSLHTYGDKIFMISHFETRPAAMYITELNQDKTTGKLSPINTKNIDFSKFGGLWVPCTGSVTPWGTNLGSEEYEPDARMIKENGEGGEYYNLMAEYFGGDLTKVNPYNYGWTPEVKIINEKGDVNVTKHYAMGRIAHELSYVMPDRKTVILSDDGTNTGLFMFIADKAGDLSSGVLYAVKWHQTDNQNGGSAKLEWISLGNANDNEIKKEIDKGIKFSDIFDMAEFKDDICPDGFTATKANVDSNQEITPECIKLKHGMEKIASRLESRRYAAIKGATIEFRKMEGITYNNDLNEIYIGMSEINKGMESFKSKGKDSLKYDVKGVDDIRLLHNTCGAVYRLTLKKDDKIGSNFVPDVMSGMIAGKYATTGDKLNTCDLNGLANPDNVTYINGTGTLIIGEDTGSGHQNDYIWSYDIQKDKLTRILTTPYGSETTSPYYYNNIGGFGYIIAVVQHPYGESDEDRLQNSSDARAYTGYIGPFPVITK